MKKILWISSCAPSRKAKEAGGQTFQYYFNGMLQDNRFELDLFLWVMLIEDQNLNRNLNKLNQNLFIRKKCVF